MAKGFNDYMKRVAPQMVSKKKKSAVSSKVAKIMHEGIRKNTKKPVSKSNPRRKVSQKQAVAVAYSMAKRGKT